ncbi:MAG: hypothetical protein AAF321_05400 [Pseudomonadota bacterium]
MSAPPPPSPKPALMSAAEHDRIAAAIRRAESLTAGEIFAVAARSSDSYRFIPLLWAALATLIGGTLAAFAWPLVSGTVSQGWGEGAAGASAQALALGQIAVFVCLALLTLIPAVRLALVPKPVQFARCRRHATEQFL